MPWFLERRASRSSAVGADAPSADGPSWLRPVLMVAVAAVVSMVTIIDAGHSGASRVWEEYDDSSVGG